MYEVLESLKKGKRSARLCEDGLVLTPTFAAVIDGATSKGDLRWDREKTAGRIARDIIAEGIRCLPPYVSLKETLVRLTDALNRQTKAVTGRTARELEPCNRLTASVVIYNDLMREVWQIGDCPFMADGHVFTNAKPEEAALAARRAEVLEAALREGTPEEKLQRKDPGRAAILKALRETCRQQNRTFTVLDGTDVYRPGIRVMDVSHCHHLVLASDGYPELRPTLAESEALLETQLREDPLCIRLHKATKGLQPGLCSFDDRTYLSLRLHF